MLGVTLIALIITVIVLLILAGTAISIAVNGGDIFTKTADARDRWNIAVVTEQEKTNEILSILNTITDGNGGEPTPSEPTPEPLPAGWDPTKLSSTTPFVTGTIMVDGTSREVKAPIPVGYTASDISTEDEIREGLVIYQGTETVSTDADAITTRNQFVWIPVYNINSMIMCKQNASGSICNLVRQSDGSLKCMTHHENDDNTELCGRLYGVDYIKNTDASTASGKNVYQSTLDFSTNTQTYSANSNYREPAIITGNSTGNGTSYDGRTNSSYHGLASATAFLEQLESDFEAMAKSVATYGGFYMGRYEAGYTTSSVPATGYTSVMGQKVLDATSSSANRWYGLYKRLRTNIGSLNSQMIWGSQYDQAIKFIKENRQTGELDPEIGHTDIGLKNNPGVSGTTCPNDIMKNIYDLECNRHEWTAQASNTDRRSYRGGYYYSVSMRNDFFPASHRDSDDPTGQYTGSCSRPGLFL